MEKLTSKFISELNKKGKKVSFKKWYFQGMEVKYVGVDNFGKLYCNAERKNYELTHEQLGDFPTKEVFRYEHLSCADEIAALIPYEAEFKKIDMNKFPKVSPYKGEIKKEYLSGDLIVQFNIGEDNDIEDNRKFQYTQEYMEFTFTEKLSIEMKSQIDCVYDNLQYLSKCKSIVDFIAKHGQDLVIMDGQLVAGYQELGMKTRTWER